MVFSLLLIFYCIICPYIFFNVISPFVINSLLLLPQSQVSFMVFFSFKKNISYQKITFLLSYKSIKIKLIYGIKRFIKFKSLHNLRQEFNLLTQVYLKKNRGFLLLILFFNIKLIKNLIFLFVFFIIIMTLN